MSKEKGKIYIRNPSTGQIRWKYVDEETKGSWPNYGYKVLNEKKENVHTRKPTYNKIK